LPALASAANAGTAPNHAASAIAELSILILDPPSDAQKRHGHRAGAAACAAGSVLCFNVGMSGAPMQDLFASISRPPSQESLGSQAAVLRSFVVDCAESLLDAVTDVTREAPFRFLVTPGGYRMSVGMTNCGACGWVSDTTGYRYDEHDPLSGRRWPAMPEPFLNVAVRAAARVGFADFAPDACLINRYEPGARLSMHRDSDEGDLRAPIVSVSLGLPGVFLWGGLKRSDRPRRVVLEHGDVVVWGGPTRLHYHGVLPIQEGEHPLSGRCRLNLTFRKAR
jgi:alkylated DNA repair protein (DNA oxidative demethylase)